MMAILEKETVFTDDIRPVPASELEERLERFRKKMEERYPGWEMVAINHKVAMYYFTHRKIVQNKKSMRISR